MRGFEVRATGVDLVGPDARRFCNGMFSNNVRDLSIGEHVQHALLDDRGRVRGLGDMWCVAEGHFRFFVQGLTFDQFVERYSPYVVFDDVEISLTSGKLAHVFERPSDGYFYERRRLLKPGFDLYYTGDSPVTERISSKEQLAQRIMAGVVSYPEDVVGNRLIHELGLREAVCHFEKGCYLGQETVHRVDVQGSVRRRLVLVKSEMELVGGQPLTQNGKKMGVLTSPCQVEEGFVGLAVVSERLKDGDKVDIVGAEAQVFDLS